MSKLVNARDAGKILGCENPHFIRAFTWLGILPYQRVGNVIAISEKELREFARKYDIAYHDDENNSDSEQSN